MGHRALVAVCFAGFLACQRTPPAPPDPLRSFVDARASASTQIVIERDGTTLLDRGDTPDRPQSIGNISEQFGAVLALMLVEQQRLALDEPVDKYVESPGDKARLAGVTMRHLLTHTSGLGTGALPGSMWHDTHRDYEMVGKIVARVADQPLPTLLTHLFQRAGLRHTAPCETDRPELVLALGLCSTARDLVRWQRALEGEALISTDARQVLERPGALASGEPVPFGLGVAPIRVGGQRATVRGGQERAPASFLAHLPDAKLRIAIVADPGNAELAWPLVAHLLELSPPAERPLEDSLARFAVRFSDPDRSPIRTLVEGDRLVVFAPGREKVALVHIGDHVFESADRATRLRFELTNGRITRVIYSYGDHYIAAAPTPRT